MYVVRFTLRMVTLREVLAEDLREDLGRDREQDAESLPEPVPGNLIRRAQARITTAHSLDVQAAEATDGQEKARMTAGAQVLRADGRADAEMAVGAQMNLDFGMPDGTVLFPRSRARAEERQIDEQKAARNGAKGERETAAEAVPESADELRAWAEAQPMPSGSERDLRNQDVASGVAKLAGLRISDAWGSLNPQTTEINHTRRQLLEDLQWRAEVHVAAAHGKVGEQLPERRVLEQSRAGAIPAVGAGLSGVGERGPAAGHAARTLQPGTTATRPGQENVVEQKFTKDMGG